MNLRAWLGCADEEMSLPDFFPRQTFLLCKRVIFMQSDVDWFFTEQSAVAVDVGKLA